MSFWHSSEGSARNHYICHPLLVKALPVVLYLYTVCVCVQIFVLFDGYDPKHMLPGEEYEQVI